MSDLEPQWYLCRSTERMMIDLIGPNTLEIRDVTATENASMLVELTNEGDKFGRSFMYGGGTPVLIGVRTRIKPHVGAWELWVPTRGKRVPRQ